jgi:hypothetical protein
MSVVWHGRDEVLARSVAIKVMKAEPGPDHAFTERVRREATALARLSHRHIAIVYDYGVSELGPVPAPYLVMELVDGETLGSVLRRGPIGWPTAVAIAGQVAAALSAAHAAGVVHCDVTPGNVMLCAEGVKMIDFGIASTAGDYADGVVFGTPSYLAPERRYGGRAIPASDVYGVGLLLYEMLAARLPWPDGSAAEIMAAHRTVPPEPLPDVPGLPDAVGRLAMDCLEVDPMARPKSRDLSVCLTGISRSADPRLRRTITEVGKPEGVGTTANASPRDPSAMAGASAKMRSRPSGRQRRMTLIVPHGMTSVPDPGLATQPIDEKPDWRVRVRRPFFALPSLLLVVLAVGLGWTVLGTSGGGAAARGATAGTAEPGLVAVTPSPVPNVIVGIDPTTRSASSSGAAAGERCRVSYEIVTRWVAGFTAQMTVTNAGDLPLAGWRLHFRLADGEQLGSGWNASFEQHGSDVTVQDVSYNHVVPPGGAVTLGFVAVRHGGTAAQPATFTLGDAACHH